MSNATERNIDSRLDDGLTLDEAIAASEILQTWLPKLSQYQAQLQDTSRRDPLPNKIHTEAATKATPVEVTSPAEVLVAPQPSQLEGASFDSSQETPAISQPVELQTRRTSQFRRGTCLGLRKRWHVIRRPLRPKLVHLPIDGILATIQKRKPFVLGLGSGVDVDETSRKILATELANRLSNKLDRNTLLVRVFSPKSNETVNSAESAHEIELHDQVKSIVWQAFEGSKSGKVVWNNQLAKLVIQKRDYQLLVFDLGNAASESMMRMGRLCDGVLIQISSKTDPRKTIETIKPLQDNRLPILGVWSV